MLVCRNCGSDKIYRNSNTDKNSKYRCGVCKKYKVIDTSQLKKDDEFVKNSIKLAKDKQKLQDTNRIERTTFRNYVRVDNAITEYIKELKDQISDIEFPNVKKHVSTNPTSAIVHLSDLHFNELVDVTGNKYDFNIASKRLYKFANKIIDYLLPNDIKNVYILMTGDLLNSDRRIDELLSMATNRAKASLLAVKLLSQFIALLNKYANVKVLSVTGNESRIREDYTYIDALATDNFDFMIYEILKLLFRQNKSVKFLGGDQFEHILEINNMKFLICHGHQLGKMQTNDLSKTFAKWSRKGVNIDMILCGHLHETKITDGLGRCGSLVGSNAYSDVKLNLYGRASQNLYLTYADQTVDSIRIDLQNVSKNDHMFDIDNDLDSYNAKSIQKIKQYKEIIKIIV